VQVTAREVVRVAKTPAETREVSNVLQNEFPFELSSSRLHHFLRCARAPSLTRSSVSLRLPAELAKAADRRPFRSDILGMRLSRTAPSVARRVPERLPQGLLRKGFACRESVLFLQNALKLPKVPTDPFIDGRSPLSVSPCISAIGSAKDWSCLCSSERSGLFRKDYLLDLVDPIEMTVSCD
jgi:hypothetical protein